VPIALIGVLDLDVQCSCCKLDVGAGPFSKEQGLGNEGVKDFGFLWRQLWGSAGGVEVHGSRSGKGIVGSKLDWEVVKHGLNVVFHVDADLAVVAKIKASALQGNDGSYHEFASFCHNGHAWS